MVAHRFWLGSLLLGIILGVAACTTQPVPLPPRPTVTPAPTALPAPELEPTGIEQLELIPVPERDLRDLTVRLRLGVDEVPEVVNATTPDHQVGDTLTFWVHNVGSQSNQQVTAELIHRTDVAYAWVEQGVAYDHPAIAQAVDRFSERSYPAAVAFFGNEWNPGIDLDPRLHILHTVATGSGVAGYYSSADQYSRLANPYSNEKELFYINLNWLNTRGDYRYYETVLAHEFQHMIHWHSDRNEWTWLNEGLSEFAQEVAGFGADTIFVNSFANQPDTQLTGWGVVASGNAPHYGAAYLFVRYLHQRFGAELIKTLVAEPADGMVGINAALAAHGHATDFDALFADWVVANFADQPAAITGDGRYGHDGLDFQRPISERGFDAATAQPYRGTVQNYATDYLPIAGAGERSISFVGQSSTTIMPTEPHSGQFAWWSNRRDSSDSHLTRQFDLTSVAANSPITLEVALWWDIEQHYDYGYVLVSQDSVKWTPLSAAYTSVENPAGNSFGAAYTGQSSGWVTEEFDLSPYAGQRVWLRFEYITDDAVSSAGWLIDDLRIPAIGYATDFETNDDGWVSEGWVHTDNLLTQRWLLQLLEFDGEHLISVQSIAVDAQGRADFTLTELGNGRHAVLAVSGLTPVSILPAAYEITIE